MIPTLEQTYRSVEYNCESRNKPLHLVLSAKSLQLAPTLFDPLGTAARKAPLSMGFSRKEYWSGLPFLPPGDLPDSGIEPVSLTSPGLTGGFFTTSATKIYSQSPRGDLEQTKL